MKNFLLITGLIFSIVLFGCRTSKVVTSEDVASKTSSVVDVSKASTAKAVEKDSTSKVDKSVVDEETTRTTTTTKYSQPDSSGKQYPVEQTVSQEKTNRKTNSNITEKTGKSSEVASSTNESNKSKLDANAKTSSDSKTKTKPPAAFTWMVIIISLGLVVLAYFVLKRFRVVK